jgi:hypothetical protein
MKQTPANDFVAAAIAKRHGMKNTIRTAQEARKAGLSYASGFALTEKESSTGDNVFGHDRRADGTYIFPARDGRVPVTEAVYKAYKRSRDTGGKGRGGMQGVGPVQLTWWELQDQADALGGCWKPRINMRVGFTRLADLMRNHGVRGGARRYNGAGPRAEAYADSYVALRAKWLKRFK